VLPIKHSCDFCTSDEMEFIYTPINTIRGMEVYVCNACGLLQSFATKKYESRPAGSMSADADRSSFKYTKDLVSGSYLEVFNQHVDFKCFDKILDIGSNRGAFIRWIEEGHPGKQITAIEPHPEIPRSYSSLTNVKLHNCRFENAQLPNNTYDFAFCVHTLEHAISAKEMLLGIRDALKDGGYFFLAVPNVMFYSDIIEEIFIDPHTYHFNYKLLKDFVVSLGFSVEYAGNPTGADIILLLKKVRSTNSTNKFKSLDVSFSLEVKDVVKRYSKNIINNRLDLKNSSEKLRIAAQVKKVVVWGGGRIFDALVTFGELDKNDIYLVIDKFLVSYVSEISGYKLSPPNVLENEDVNSIVVYIASRNYADEIMAEARTYGINDFIVFGNKSNKEVGE
jgi:SAM-dependent methyltransferase